MHFITRTCAYIRFVCIQVRQDFSDYGVLPADLKFDDYVTVIKNPLEAAEARRPSCLCYFFFFSCMSVSMLRVDRLLLFPFSTCA